MLVYENDYKKYKDFEDKAIEMLKENGFRIMKSESRYYDFTIENLKGDVKIQNALEDGFFVFETRLEFYDLVNNGFVKRNEVKGWLYNYDIVLFVDKKFEMFYLVDLKKIRTNGVLDFSKEKANKRYTFSQKGWILRGFFIMARIEDLKEYILWKKEN